MSGRKAGNINPPEPLTPMQIFALKIIREYDGEMSPNQIAAQRGLVKRYPGEYEYYYIPKDKLKIANVEDDKR